MKKIKSEKGAIAALVVVAGVDTEVEGVKVEPLDIVELTP